MMNFLMDCQTKGKQLRNDDVGEIQSAVKKASSKQYNNKENNRSKPNNEIWSSWGELRGHSFLTNQVYPMSKSMEIYG